MTIGRRRVPKVGSDRLGRCDADGRTDAAGAERAGSFHGEFSKASVGSVAGYDIQGSVTMTIASAGADLQ